MKQFTLFDSVCEVYRQSPEEPVTQGDLYAAVGKNLSLDVNSQQKKATLKDGSTFNVFHRDCRWAQQQLKEKGLLQRVSRGMWQLTNHGKDTLTEIKPGFVCVAFSTRLGVCLWADAASAGEHIIDDNINLILTSPPYFRIGRNYGQFLDEKEYLEFILDSLSPFLNRLAPGAGVVLNLGNDVFESKRPTRSAYIERLVVTLIDKMHLHLVERICWKSNKCPGPTYWSFVKRFMLRSNFEFTFCFTNDPLALRWDNLAVRETHNDAYLQWCNKGGQKEAWKNDNYRKRAGAFSNTGRDTKVPTNVMSLGHTCSRNRQLKNFAKENGYPDHTALFPVRFAAFFIKWMTNVNDLVVDMFGGWLNTAHAAEELNRRWLTSDKHLEFLNVGSQTFDCDQSSQLPNLPY